MPGLSSKGRGIKVNPVGQCVGGPEEAKERVFQEAREARKGREQCANDGGTEGHGYTGFRNICNRAYITYAGVYVIGPIYVMANM